MRTLALIMAAGRGSRMTTDQPKQYLSLGGEVILRRSVLAFLNHPRVEAVRVVIHPEDRAAYEAAIGDLGLPEPVSGGATRQDSVRLGLEALAKDPPTQVLIHDAARPLVPAEVIDRVLAALAESDGALPGLPVTDSLKQVRNSAIAASIPRENLWRAQTPQGFRYPAILAAHRAAERNDFSDDAGIAEAAGLAIHMVEGAAVNEKITTFSDLERAERMLHSPFLELRSGQGFDVHRFDATRRGLVLCGVCLPEERALTGHSDADVGLHALTDAILGALCLGDIGLRFPASDPQWKGADSAIFLADAVEALRQRGGRIHHLDLTIICERPKIGPHREAMRARIAEILDTAIERVSVKATTTEGLGFTGRGEGIAAQALATLALPAEIKGS